MALTNAGTVVSLPSSRVPSDFTAVAVTTFSDWEQESQVLTLSVLKSTVENSDPATTLLAIISNATIGINKQVSDLVTDDWDVTRTVTVYAELTGIDSNVAASATTDFYTDTAMSYTCTVKYYVKASA
jgi:hypothetical protein